MGLLIKYYRFRPIAQNAVGETPAKGAGEHDTCEVATLFDQVFELVRMGDTDDILFDDGAIVQHFRDVVAGGANQLDTTFEGPVAGLRAHKRGEERMVNVDDAVGKSRHEFR